MDIIADHVYKSYGGLQVLSDFSYCFPEGRTTCIMGASGCGKTTLLHILMGIEKPDKGTVQGVPYGKISAVFQENRLCENLSAMANLKFTCGKEKEALLHKGMEDLGLADAFHKPVRELSGGMRRRVAILRALFANSDCIMMDEPLKGLDDETRALAAAYMKEHTRGKTLIVITHDSRDETLLGAERVLQMDAHKGAGVRRA